MSMKLKFDTTFLIGSVLAGSSAQLTAGGFRLPDQDAFATARGEAFVATADTPAAIYYNPAGIVQLPGNNFRAGIYGIYLDPHFTSPSGREFENENTLHAVPQVFFSHAAEDSPLSYGIGAYAPYGLGLKWADDTGFRTVGKSAELTYFTLNPVVALKLAPNFSIAGGLTINYADADLRQGLVWPNQDNDLFRYEGHGWDVGYNLGLLWKVHEKVSIGMSFRSATTVGLSGHTEYFNREALQLAPEFVVPAFPKQRVAADLDLPCPLNAIFGISYRPTPDWNFEFNADYADWGALSTVTIRQAHGFPPLLPQNIPVTFDWHPSWYYEFGATRYLSKGWSVSAGYIFNENSTSDAHYTPLVADVDKHFFSAGLGHKGQRFDFDVAYQFGYGPGHTVSGSAPSAIGQTANGAYEFFSHAILISVGMHF